MHLLRMSWAACMINDKKRYCKTVISIDLHIGQMCLTVLQYLFLGMKKAGDGNRTHVSSLEGWCSTIELHPQICSFLTTDLFYRKSTELSTRILKIIWIQR